MQDSLPVTPDSDIDDDDIMSSPATTTILSDLPLDLLNEIFTYLPFPFVHHVLSHLNLFFHDLIRWHPPTPTPTPTTTTWTHHHLHCLRNLSLRPWFHAALAECPGRSPDAAPLRSRMLTRRRFRRSEEKEEEEEDELLSHSHRTKHRMDEDLLGVKWREFNCPSRRWGGGCEKLDLEGVNTWRLWGTPELAVRPAEFWVTKGTGCGEEGCLLSFLSDELLRLSPHLIRYVCRRVGKGGLDALAVSSVPFDSDRIVSNIRRSCAGGASGSVRCFNGLRLAKRTENLQSSFQDLWGAFAGSDDYTNPVRRGGGLKKLELEGIALGKAGLFLDALQGLGRTGLTTLVLRDCDIGDVTLSTATGRRLTMPQLRVLELGCFEQDNVLPVLLSAIICGELEKLTLRGPVGSATLFAKSVQHLRVFESDSYGLDPNVLQTVRKLTVVAHFDDADRSKLFESETTLTSNFLRLETLEIDHEAPFVRTDSRRREQEAQKTSIRPSFATLFGDRGEVRPHLTRIVLSGPEVKDALLNAIAERYPSLRSAVLSNYGDVPDTVPFLRYDALIRYGEFVAQVENKGDERAITGEGVSRFMEILSGSLKKLVLPLVYSACQRFVFAQVKRRYESGAALRHFEVWGNLLNDEVIRFIDAIPIRIAVHGIKVRCSVDLAGISPPESADFVRWNCPLKCGAVGEESTFVDAQFAKRRHFENCEECQIPLFNCSYFFAYRPSGPDTSGLFHVRHEGDEAWPEIPSVTDWICPLGCGHRKTISTLRDGEKNNHFADCPSNIIKCPLCSSESEVRGRLSDLQEHKERASQSEEHRRELWDVIPRPHASNHSKLRFMKKISPKERDLDRTHVDMIMYQNALSFTSEVDGREFASVVKFGVGGGRQFARGTEYDVLSPDEMSRLRALGVNGGSEEERCPVARVIEPAYFGSLTPQDDAM